MAESHSASNQQHNKQSVNNKFHEPRLLSGRGQSPSAQTRRASVFACGQIRDLSVMATSPGLTFPSGNTAGPSCR